MDDLALNRIISGNVAINLGSDVFFVRPFTPEVKYAASVEAARAFDSAFSDGILLLEECYELSEWTEEEEQALTELIPKNLEQMKLDYFNRFAMKTSRDQIGKQIKSVQKMVVKLSQKKYEFYQYTCEYIQSLVYELFCIEHSLYLGESKTTLPCSIDQIKNKYNESICTSQELRSLARSSSWKTIWNSADKTSGIFNLPSNNLTDEQLELISWTKFYDSVYQSMDCPSDEIIDDEIALDGWFINQSRKREEGEKERQKERFTSNNHAQEVFIPAYTKEQELAVMEMNGREGKKVLSSISNDIKTKGVVKENDLTHVRNNIKMNINNAGRKK